MHWDIVSKAFQKWDVRNEVNWKIEVIRSTEQALGKALRPSLAATADEAWRFPLPIPAGLFEVVTELSQEMLEGRDCTREHSQHLRLCVPSLRSIRRDETLPSVWLHRARS
jgi:hypothetical protein